MLNLTITVPDGSSNHGNPRLLCTPPSWFDYIIFFFSNYFAHAATVITNPGQGRKETIFVILAALLFPGLGIVRAMEAIRRHSSFEFDPLRRALRAGALCMVVRLGSETSQGPNPLTLEEGRRGVLVSTAKESNEKIGPAGVGITATDADIAQVKALTPSRKDSAKKLEERPWWDPAHPVFLPDDAVVHGQYRLPAGYALAFVPLKAARELESPDQASSNTLASSYNFPKMLISLIQAAWAIITLYRARGDQIQEFGYAAFGLTVAPYAFMSLMNIIGSLLNPEYNAIFLVRTPLMDQAESHAEFNGGGFFAAEVLFKAVENPKRPHHPSSAINVPVLTIHAFGPDLDDDKLLIEYGRMNILLDYGVMIEYGAVIVGCIPLAIIGALSGFQPGNSSSLQRGFTLSWVVMGIITAPFFYNLDKAPQGRDVARFYFGRAAIIIYGAAAIGGMAMVGLMIRDFGVCTLLL
ncbi:uncharacterized protein B0T15DRAFT_314050 [Chaetomium strumarium]|uniref:Uncharacterized protein n=1 Tax=Chaetomium strumarium TaxID=1170767 RepID=A0AAJ0LYY5_9PEZI|nr:hypothetical protein B0T15DRAFT_314050 [Chaetomium strumarium]